jgi:hypothetical protein
VFPELTTERQIFLYSGSVGRVEGGQLIDLSHMPIPLSDYEAGTASISQAR